ncbi:MAG: aromatic ring-hydroxylating dioxygenase subunit alpha [Alphaproteobacteria bacterium]|nr:aromatic ring-hydroxylating dioxygenase subunit alpha [Alphaproteobacteria bacterium]MCW5740869.1 aromatic ring-hydroxylating dioxygenase subunit alpha [Alphaproteobacteria bacterium]
MISREQNDLITRTGPAAPCGTLMRQYWQPIALAVELQGPRPLRSVRLMGQDLVVFRDESGKLALIDRDCPHRGADLAYGRLEHGGLRCPFHGWLFDVQGNCLEMPGEPDGGGVLCQRVKQKSYPVVERSGIIWGYLGAGEAPAFPDFDCFIAPDSHVFAFKGHMACNWLQALEVGIDPAHASFLHRFEEDESASGSNTYGRQFRAASMGSDIPMTTLLREFPRPDIDVQPVPWGLRLFSRRRIDKQRTHLRVTNLIFPNAFLIPLSGEMTITQWHVPVDDTSNYWYAIFTSFGGPVDKKTMTEQRLDLYQLPDYKPRLGRHNEWGYDPAEQRSKTFTGMGFDINVHDQWACESQGPIADRTREHLGTTDKAIIANRRLLVKAIEQAQAGERPLMVLDRASAAGMTGPATMDAIGPTEGWESFWPEIDRKRRDSAPWKRSAA